MELVNKDDKNQSAEQYTDLIIQQLASQQIRIIFVPEVKLEQKQ